MCPPTRPGEVGERLPREVAEAPGGPAEWEAMFRDLDELVVPHTTHWQSPRFFAYFPANASYASVLGELLAAGIAGQGMLWQTAPAANEIERRLLDQFGRLIGLPESFLGESERGGGCIQGTASESTLSALLAARARARARRQAAGQSGDGEYVVYASSQAHSSVTKAAMIAGVAFDAEDTTHSRAVGVDAELRCDPAALERELRLDLAAGRTPLLLVGTVGTTSSGACDPLGPLAQVVERVGDEARPWLHVDAAWAGAALICPEHRPLIAGVEAWDSLCLNPHKWLLTNFDCDLFWTQDRQAVVSAHSITPAYLRSQASESGAVFDYRDWGVPLGRRFRALKLWLVLRHYGAEGLRAFIRNHCAWAAELARWIEADPRVELAAPPSLGLVCFRLVAGDDAGRNLVARLHEEGEVYLTPTELNGRFAIRFSIGAVHTERRHVEAGWSAIQRALNGR